MKVVLWIVLIVAGAAIAGRLLGFGIGHGIAATSDAPASAESGPWEAYQRTQAPAAPACPAGATCIPQSEIDRANANIQRDAQAQRQAQTLADELRQ